MDMNQLREKIKLAEADQDAGVSAKLIESLESSHRDSMRQAHALTGFVRMIDDAMTVHLAAYSHWHVFSGLDV